MAERRTSGLTFGQLITLTFGFLLASVVIFVFGFWVGRDLAEQQAAKQRDVARVPIAPPPPEPTRLVAAPAVPAAPVAVAAAKATSTVVPAATATPVMIVKVAATATRAVAVRTPAGTPTPAANGWTVQAYATNDTVRAVMLARTLRAKGYDASTGTKQVGGTTWFLVRVGHFRDHNAAKAMEAKLRSEEGLEAASVTAQ